MEPRCARPSCRRRPPGEGLGSSWLCTQRGGRRLAPPVELDGRGQLPPPRCPGIGVGDRASLRLPATAITCQLQGSSCWAERVRVCMHACVCTYTRIYEYMPNVCVFANTHDKRTHHTTGPLTRADMPHTHTSAIIWVTCYHNSTWMSHVCKHAWVTIAHTWACQSHTSSLLTTQHD